METPMTLTLTEAQFERVTSALNVALSLALMHAPSTHPEVQAIANEMDDAWNEQNYGDYIDV